MPSPTWASPKRLASCSRGSSGSCTRKEVRPDYSCDPLPSRSTVLNYRVQLAELDASVRRGELPVYTDLALIPLLFPGRHLSAQLFATADAPVQTLPRQHAQLDLRHVQPTAMLGRVMDLQPLDDAPGLLRRERLVQRRRLVRVQVVQHQHHPLGLRMNLFDEPAHHLGEVLGRPPLGDLHGPPTQQRLG